MLRVETRSEMQSSMVEVLGRYELTQCCSMEYIIGYAKPASKICAFYPLSYNFLKPYQCLQESKGY